MCSNKLRELIKHISIPETKHVNDWWFERVNLPSAMTEEKFNSWDSMLLHLRRWNIRDVLPTVWGMIMKRIRRRWRMLTIGIRRRRIEIRLSQIIRCRKKNQTQTEEYLSVQHLHGQIATTEKKTKCSVIVCPANHWLTKNIKWINQSLANEIKSSPRVHWRHLPNHAFRTCQEFDLRETPAIGELLLLTSFSLEVDEAIFSKWLLIMTSLLSTFTKTTWDLNPYEDLVGVMQLEQALHRKRDWQVCQHPND